MRELSLEPGSGAFPNAEAIRDELELVLNSPAFKRSERHSKFLRFVCETTLKGEGSKLNEYMIAHEVFERGEDYSPGEDSVVRRQAYSLRQKLQEYYSTDGAADPIRIELPLGRYVPNFTPAVRKPEPVTPRPEMVVALPRAEPLPVREATEPRAKEIPWWWYGCGATLIVVVFLMGWLLGGRATSQGSPDGAIAEIWGGWLNDPRGAVLCFSNPYTAVIQRIDKPFSTDVIPRRLEVTDEQAKVIREQLNMPAGGSIYLYPGIGHAKMGEALGSVAMTAFFAKAGIPVIATQSRFINWEDFRTKNLILLGHDEANPWLDPILGKLPLRMAPTQADKPRRIINTDPRKGESAEYVTGFAVSSHRIEDYALVSMISGIDDRHRLLLINGVNTEGTEIAQEFLTDEVSARRLLAMLRQAAPKHKGVWHFQMVLHADVRDNVPTRVDLVAVRVL